MAGTKILEPATLAGLGLVAIWLYVRYPRLRPQTIMRAMGHVAASFGLFVGLPYSIDLVKAVVSGKAAILVFVAMLLVPALTYVLYSWLAFMAKLHDLADSTPRGGHRVPEGAAS